MGYKLGKMVNKKIIFLLILCTNISAEFDKQPIKKLSIEKLSSSNEARIIKFSANPNNIELKKINIAKPNKDQLGRFATLSRKDKYALKILNEQGKQVYLIGLGDPFYVHADHIGYEKSGVYGGVIDANLNIVLPLNIDASSIVFLSQDDFGLKEIKKIQLK
jgi:hypothetical protein